MNTYMISMDAFKEAVYVRAGVSLEDQIEKAREDIIYWQFLRENYPLDIDETNADDNGLSPDQVERSKMDAVVKLKNLKLARPFVKTNVENMVTQIYEQISDFYMDFDKFMNLSVLIHNFMKITGKPWIGALGLTQLSVFLRTNWGGYMIPNDREEVWTKIPRIGAVFMDQFHRARNAGGRLPNTYSLEDGPYARAT